MARNRAPRKAQTGPAEDVSICVYIGPTIRGVVNYGAIFHGTYQEVIQAEAEMVEQFPPIRHLIVPGENLGQARIDIHTPGNSIYVYKQRLVRMLDGKN